MPKPKAEKDKAPPPPVVCPHGTRPGACADCLRPKENAYWTRVEADARRVEDWLAKRADDLGIANPKGGQFSLFPGVFDECVAITERYVYNQRKTELREELVPEVLERILDKEDKLRDEFLEMCRTRLRAARARASVAEDRLAALTHKQEKDGAELQALRSWWATQKAPSKPLTAQQKRGELFELREALHKAHALIAELRGVSFAQVREQTATYTPPRPPAPAPDAFPSKPAGKATAKRRSPKPGAKPAAQKPRKGPKKRPDEIDLSHWKTMKLRATPKL